MSLDSSKNQNLKNNRKFHNVKLLLVFFIIIIVFELAYYVYLSKKEYKITNIQSPTPIADLIDKTAVLSITPIVSPANPTFITGTVTKSAFPYVDILITSIGYEKQVDGEFKMVEKSTDKKLIGNVLQLKIDTENFRTIFLLPKKLLDEYKKNNNYDDVIRKSKSIQVGITNFEKISDFNTLIIPDEVLLIE